MANFFGNKKNEIKGSVLPEYTNYKSAVNYNVSRDMIVEPTIPFQKCQEYYLTVGKVQNTVESFVSQIVNRDWYFESENDTIVQKLKMWEDKIHLSRLIEDLVRNWLVFGHVIIGKSDFAHVQYTSIVGMIRDEWGIPIKFIQQVGYSKSDLIADEFFSEPFIQLDRAGWGFGLYHSLMNTYVDENGEITDSILAIYRRMEQDISKIHHKYASPRTIIAFPEASQDQMTNNILPLLKTQKQGDRLALNYKPEIISESIDAQARFTESIRQINSEVEAGLQSSSSRLITQPSAMADAREAGALDDERVLALMEKIRRFFDERIIPYVLGEENLAFFKWGAKDSFDLQFPSGLEKALTHNIITPDEARNILMSRGWKLNPETVNPKPDPQLTNIANLMQQSNDLQKQNAPINDLNEESYKLRKEAYEKILKLINNPKKKNVAKNQANLECKNHNHHE